jgi:hypothetical protein
MLLGDRAAWERDRERLPGLRRKWDADRKALPAAMATS